MGYYPRYWTSFNRTKVELKFFYSQAVGMAKPSFNRTKVELKWVLGSLSAGTDGGFNRTKVELKYNDDIGGMSDAAVLIVPKWN